MWTRSMNSAESPSTLFIHAFESLPWTTVYLLCCSTAALPVPRHCAPGFILRHGENLSFTLLSSVPSYCPPALPLLPHHDSSAQGETHTFRLVDMWSGLYRMNLFEPLLTSPITLFMNMQMLSDCSQTIKQEYSASQQLLTSRIPAFIYNYSQRWVVSEWLSHLLGRFWFFSCKEGFHLSSPAKIFLDGTA